MPLHNHLLLNGWITDPPGPDDESRIKKWLDDLVVKIGMKKVAGPIASYVHADGNAGMTAGVLIETSHIAMHIWDEVDPAKLQFDLYTCSTLPLSVVINELYVEFGLQYAQYQVLERENGFRTVISDVFPIMP